MLNQRHKENTSLSFSQSGRPPVFSSSVARVNICTINSLCLNVHAFLREHVQFPSPPFPESLTAPGRILCPSFPFSPTVGFHRLGQHLCICDWLILLCTTCSRFVNCCKWLSCNPNNCHLPPFAVAACKRPS